MLSMQPATRHKESRTRIGVAIAGGGPVGGMYELGVLRALDEAVEGLDLTNLTVYVGVSSGAFIAAALANRMHTADITRIFVTESAHDVKFRPEQFLRPAFYEYAKRLSSVPRVLLRWWRDVLLDPSAASANDALNRLGSLIPTGLFDNEEIGRFLARAFSVHGRTNDFRELRRKLFVVAVDLDSGEAVRFGASGWDDVPISRSIQASSALPGLYPPVTIRNRQFVDGALRRTMHASVAMEQDIDLLLGINPLVPFDATQARAAGRPPASLVEGGLPAVLSQTFRTLLQSRMQVGIAKYAQQYDDVDKLYLEPDANDAEMFFTSAFSYRSRRYVCDHAYRATLNDLSKQRERLGPLLARHGLRLREEVIGDQDRTMLDGLTPERRRHSNTTARLRRALDDVDSLLVQRRRAPARRRR
jgi:predicted acylesterase/phospholipase RssA